MERPDAYPITYGVLALLAFMGPMSGYDLKRCFDSMLAPMWGAAHSQIYNELRRMQKLAWVDMEREEQESRPDRKVYHITAQGRQALTQWHLQPAADLQIRDELLLKIMFGSFASTAALLANVKTGIIYHEDHLSEYRVNLNLASTFSNQPHTGSWYMQDASAPAGDPFLTLIAHFSIAFEETYLRWLYEVRAFLEQRLAQETQDTNP